MVDDRSKAGDELKAVAPKKNFTLPVALDAKDQATVKRLAEFDGRGV